jgi:PilZ domain-containing protein
MSTDFSKYQSIINRLRGKVGSSEFEANFETLTKSLANTDKFLLKMEVKRLASPCTRLIDLRGLVNGECRAYEHQERVHYLDDVAIKVFEENFAYYGGYTFGVYDVVTNTENNFRVIYQKEKSVVQQSSDTPAPIPTNAIEKNQYPATLYSTANYYNRREERMNFVINLNISIDDKTFYKAVSSDVSISGAKLRITEMKPLHLDQIITLAFTGLEGELKHATEQHFSYQVRNITLIDKVQLVGIERIYSDEDKDNQLTSFLKDYIQSNKRRYKINLDNTFSALHTRMFEHFSLTKINELPIFISKDKLTLKYALTSANNQGVYQYWQDEESHSTLSFLLNKQRIERLKKSIKQQSSLLVYCFIHQNQGKYYFYSADELQLKQDKDSMAQFLGFAAAKSSFAVFNLSLLFVQPEFAYSPYTLANSNNQQDEYLNAKPSPLVEETLAKLPYIITISDITEHAGVPEYRQLDCQVHNIEKLKQFGHRKTKTVNTVEEIDINYSNQRQELRFVYQTSATIVKDGVNYKGDIKDFSISGLNIELAKSEELSKGDVVYLSFPRLQQMTSKFVLKQLPYEIVRINKQKTIFRLRAYVEQHQHEGRTFFKFLIDRNSDKLQLDEYALTIPGLAKALRNIYAQAFIHPSLIMQTSGSRYKSETIICSRTHSDFLAKLSQLSAHESKQFNLYPIFQNANILGGLTNTLKKMHVTDEPCADVIYIAIKAKIAAIEKTVNIKRESELKTVEAKKAFIKRALKQGDFYCVQLKLSRTNAPDMNYLNPELTYISAYAIHRAKQLEQEILSVAGVIQLIDITNEAMVRYRLF